MKIKFKIYNSNYDQVKTVTVKKFTCRIDYLSGF